MRGRRSSGLPALAFTDHLDLTGWLVEEADLVADESFGRLRSRVDSDGVLTPEPFDATGYLACVQRCRSRFPQLRILTGVEFGQPHLDEVRAWQLVDLDDLVNLDDLDRVNGSLHTVPLGEEHGSTRAEPTTLYRRWPAERVIREYLAELIRMIDGSPVFEVLCHIEYAVRYWPVDREGPFNPRDFEDEFRQAMRTLAGTGRALELNIGGQLRPWIPQWWREEGGRAITLASDAHTPDVLASNVFEAMAMAEHVGFRPGRHPEDPWTR